MPYICDICDFLFSELTWLSDLCLGEANPVRTTYAIEITAAHCWGYLWVKAGFRLENWSSCLQSCALDSSTHPPLESTRDTPPERPQLKEPHPKGSKWEDSDLWTWQRKTGRAVSYCCSMRAQWGDLSTRSPTNLSIRPLNYFDGLDSISVRISDLKVWDWVILAVDWPLNRPTSSQ